MDNRGIVVRTMRVIQPQVQVAMRVEIEKQEITKQDERNC